MFWRSFHGHCEIDIIWRGCLRTIVFIMRNNPQRGQRKGDNGSFAISFNALI